MEAEKILVVDSDSRAVELSVIKLSNAGYCVVSALDGEEALSKINDNPVDLILISPVLAKKDGYEVCATILQNKDLRQIPIVFMVDERFDEEQFQRSGLTVADIIIKPFNPKDLLARVNLVLAKARLIKEMNPLTGLPGLVQIQEQVTSRIASGVNFALIFTDLKGFKVYNKYYGFEQGDQVIKWLVKLIREEISLLNMISAIPYHLGGDHFLVYTEDDSAEALCQNIVCRFDREIPRHYITEDQNRGGLAVRNRQGLVEQWPIMTIALGIVSNKRRRIQNWLEAELISDELLTYAKSMPGSQFVLDRRRS